MARRYLIIIIEYRDAQMVARLVANFSIDSRAYMLRRAVVVLRADAVETLNTRRVGRTWRAHSTAQQQQSGTHWIKSRAGAIEKLTARASRWCGSVSARRADRKVDGQVEKRKRKKNAFDVFLCVDTQGAKLGARSKSKRESPGVVLARRVGVHVNTGPDTACNSCTHKRSIIPTHRDCDFGIAWAGSNHPPQQGEVGCAAVIGCSST